MVPGDIYLANFPFGGGPGMKLRPVLLLTDQIGTVPEVLVAYVSSVIPSQLLPTDLILDPQQPQYRTTGLKSVSVLRLQAGDDSRSQHRAPAGELVFHLEANG
jgi:mRNA interferase MazF